VKAFDVLGARWSAGADLGGKVDERDVVGMTSREPAQERIQPHVAGIVRLAIKGLRPLRGIRCRCRFRHHHYARAASREFGQRGVHPRHHLGFPLRGAGDDRASIEDEV